MSLLTFVWSAQEAADSSYIYSHTHTHTHIHLYTHTHTHTHTHTYIYIYYIGSCRLFFDAPKYNAHTSAGDAIWAGVPVMRF